MIRGEMESSRAVKSWRCVRPPTWRRRSMRPRDMLSTAAGVPNAFRPQDESNSAAGFPVKKEMTSTAAMDYF